MLSNKLCNLSDWKELEPEMLSFLDEKPKQFDRKHWEIAMSLRAFEKLPEGSRVLGVGAGDELTIFHLCNLGMEVHATDMYHTEGDQWKISQMLVDPAECSPFPFKSENLIVQNMDGRKLRYPDNYFDAIFSSSSLEHFGNLDDIKQAAAEMGRVLKPGGIVSIATEFYLDGPDNGGFHNVVLFTPERIQELVVEPSGLKMVGKADYSVDEDTMLTATDLLYFIQKRQRGEPIDAPNVVIRSQFGHVFTSVQITLRKPKTRSK